MARSQELLGVPISLLTVVRKRVTHISLCEIVSLLGLEVAAREMLAYDI
jgi:hypothetical protein